MRKQKVRACLQVCALQREREREREREKDRRRERERCRIWLFLFLKGMTGALAPFGYLVCIYIFNTVCVFAK
jgi:hypothetical protein